jgi:PAS domain S-box-containing protein
MKERLWSRDDVTLLTVVGNLLADLLVRIHGHKRLRTLVERSHDCYVRATKLPPAIEYVSPSWEHLTGYTCEEYMGDPGLVERSVHPGDREIFRTMLQEPGADRAVRLPGAQERWALRLG